MTKSPPLVPTHDYETYLVVDQVGRVRLYRETVEEQADKETVIADIASGQYERPVRIVAFNTAEGWSRDATEDVAREMLDRAARKVEPLSKLAVAFIEWATGDDMSADLVSG
jgi:hypothetical protein